MTVDTKRGLPPSGQGDPTTLSELLRAAETTARLAIAELERGPHARAAYDTDATPADSLAIAAAAMEQTIARFLDAASEARAMLSTWHRELATHADRTAGNAPPLLVTETHYQSRVA